MLKRALNWAAAGWHVFPVRDNKRPYFSDWNEAASTSPLVIEGWWKSVPEAQVGVVPAMSEAYVIDVDVKDGKDGYGSLKKLEEEYHFRAEDYPSQQTRSGGRHIFMRGYAPTSVEVLGGGIDTRGGLADGTSRGYILAYQDAPPARPEDCPVGVVFQFAKRDRSSGASPPLVELDLDENIKRARDYLSQVVAVPEGSRGITLFKHAATVKDLGVGLQRALELFAENPAALGDPPQDADEAYGRIASAYRNGQLPPGVSAIEPEHIKALVAEEKAKGRPKRKRLATWPEMKDRPEPGWIIRNLIPAKSLVGMYGPGGSFKSFIAADMALAISTGRMEWGEQDVLTSGPVVVISGEGSLGPRVRAWEVANGSEVGDNFAVLDGLDLSDGADIVAAAAEIDQAIEEKWGGRKPIILIVDTLARASGAADENSNKDMGRIIVACDELRRHFDCTVLLVHHTPKSGNDWRGATAVYFALDAGLSVKRSGNNRVGLVVARMKDGNIGDQWSIKLAEIATGKEKQGEPERSLALSSVKHVGYNVEEKKDKLQERQEIRGKMLTQARAETTREILSHLLPNQTVTASILAKQVAAAMGALGAVGDIEGTRTFLNRAVNRPKDGRSLNTEHPLADCVVTLDPLTFGAPKMYKSEFIHEKPPEVSSEGLLD